MSLRPKVSFGVAGTAVLLILPLHTAHADAGAFQTKAPLQISGSTTATSNGWSVTPLVTIGEEGPAGEDVNLNAFGYRPIGILDGIAAFPLDGGVLRFFVNHEVGGTAGYAYTLANGTVLKGSRVSYIDVDTCSRRVLGMGPAYGTIYDRTGAIVTAANQINEGNGVGAIDRLCGSNGFRAGEYGIVNNIYLAGEEVGEGGATPATGMGGQQFAIDVDQAIAYVIPMVGRGAWEASTFIENFGSNKIAMLWGDDREGAPMWLYIGEKGALPPTGSYAPPSFLVHNGFGFGYLFAWKADNGDTTPQQFNGTGSIRTGSFVRVNNYDPTLAGLPNWDALGFASGASLDAQSQALGGFRLSRPEDVATNPNDGTQVIHASTGRGSLFSADNWGTVYLFDFDDAALEKALKGDLAAINNVPCTVKIIYAGDDSGGGQFAAPDFGIRSPDNLEWADDGYVYINEDKSTTPGSLFGAISGVEASVWRLDVTTSEATRILEINRAGVPLGQFDPLPNDKGNWETSGVLDVSKYLATEAGEVVLVLDVQAHSLKSDLGNGLAKNAAQGADLVEGGQFVLATKGGANVACMGDFNCDGIVDGADIADLLGAWGACIGCAGDIDGNGSIDGVDLAYTLGNWGDCIGR